MSFGTPYFGDLTAGYVSTPHDGAFNPPSRGVSLARVDDSHALVAYQYATSTGNPGTNFYASRVEIVAISSDGLSLTRTDMLDLFSASGVNSAATSAAYAQNTPMAVWLSDGKVCVVTQDVFNPGRILTKAWHFTLWVLTINAAGVITSTASVSLPDDSLDNTTSSMYVPGRLSANRIGLIKVPYPNPTGSGDYLIQLWDAAALTFISDSGGTLFAGGGDILYQWLPFPDGHVPAGAVFASLSSRGFFGADGSHFSASLPAGATGVGESWGTPAWNGHTLGLLTKADGNHVALLDAAAGSLTAIADALPPAAAGNTFIVPENTGPCVFMESGNRGGIALPTFNTPGGEINVVEDVLRTPRIQTLTADPTWPGLNVNRGFTTVTMLNRRALIIGFGDAGPLIPVTLSLAGIPPLRQTRRSDGAAGGTPRATRGRSALGTGRARADSYL